MKNIKSKKSNYLFIIESNNDLDMIAPIIWKFSKDNYANVFIINASPGNLSSKDPRIKFILKHSTVKYIEILKDFKFLDDISSYIYSVMKIGFFHRNFFNSILGYSQKKFDKIQISKDLPTVIFVSYFSGHNAVKSAIMWAEKHKFLKVFNSHGITPFKVKINSNENIKAPVFDICILNKNSEKNLPYFDKKKTKKIYLAPRFSEEWSSKLLEIYPKKKLKNTKKKKFKIAFILSKWLYKDDKDKILSTIRTTSQIKNTQIIIKPHTRGMVLDEKIPNNVLIADNSYHTRSIIQDSDVIIFTRSSIFLDAILLNKQLIHLSYATNVDLASNALNSCKAFSQEDLIQKLGLIKLGRKIYTQNDRKKCLSTYAGKDNGKMLDNLLREIKAHINVSYKLT